MSPYAKQLRPNYKIIQIHNYGNCVTICGILKCLNMTKLDITITTTTHNETIFVCIH